MTDNIIKPMLQEWISDYNSRIVPASVLINDVQKFMQNFEKEEIRRKEEEKNEEQPDDEGWIKITTKGKRAGVARTEKMEEKLKAKRRRYEKAIMNFTPTQIKETKAKQLADLKKKFEEDKQRIALLKAQRKFKPF